MKKHFEIQFSINYDDLECRLCPPVVLTWCDGDAVVPVPGALCVHLNEAPTLLSPDPPLLCV